jgi:membrane fusion protein, multidrug efflux system
MTDASDTPGETNNASRNRTLLIVTVIFLLIGIGWFLYWWLIGSRRVITDDAYVAGDMIAVSARVPGTVIEWQGKNTEQVRAGQVIARLDTADAEAQLHKAASGLASAVREFRQQQAQAAQLDATITTQQLNLQHATADLARREPLVKDNAIAGEELTHAREAVALANAALVQTQRQASTVHALIDGTSAHNNPMVLQAKSVYVDAWLAAQRNVVLAPTNGFITQKNIALGQRIQPGQTLLTIVPLDALWIEANFKEVQLANLRIGQTATIASDLYGSKVEFHGKVAGIGIGTGAAFSLLPAQNASGNWIKVIQRVPVRIDLEPRELAEHPLRIGLSMTVKVATQDRSGPILSALDKPPTRQQTNVYAVEMSQAEAAVERIIAQQL